MSTRATGSAKSGLGLWPKLVLWSLVLVFGVLYLGSVKRNPAVDAPAAVTASPPTPAPEVAPPPGDGGLDPEVQQVPADKQDLASAGDQATSPQAPAADSGPVSAAESAAFVDSLLSKEPADPSPGESSGPPDLEALSSPATTPSGAPDLTPPASEARDDRTLSAAAVEPAGPIPQTAAEPPAALGEPATSREAAAGDRALDAQEAQRERILKEYEAMRRAAEAQMRRYWQPWGVPGPAGMPYGPPGYGFAPQGYPPK